MLCWRRHSPKSCYGDCFSSGAMQMECNSPQPNQCQSYTAVGHAQDLLKHLYTLRSEKAFCDATIIVGSETFTAHCVILSARSEYFKGMFSGGLSESFSKQVELRGIEAGAFSSLLDFIYTDGDCFSSGAMQMDCNSPQPNQCLSYTAVGHAEDFLKHLYTLRSEKAFCDATIIVGSKMFTAHRVILSARSEYFKRMFSGGLSESFSKQVELHGIEARAFSSLLDFIYTGEIDITSENVQDLLLAADMLQILDVIQPCFNFLRSQLHPSNCLGIHKLASAHSCEEVCAACEVFMHKHFLQVVRHAEFKELEYSELLVLLSSEYLRIENELQVFKAVLKWILHDATQRKECLVQILEPVRFPIISSKKLFDCIEKKCNNRSIKVALRALLADYNPKNKSKLKKSSNRPPTFKMKPRLNAQRYLYVIGGCRSKKTLDSVDRFNPFNQVWTSMPNLIEPRYSHTVVTLDGVIYVIGGYVDGGIMSNSVESFNPLEGKWVPNVAMTLRAPRTHHGSCVFDGAIYVFGGCIRGGKVSQAIECYSPESQKWIEAGKMLSPRAQFGLVESAGLIYLFGGRYMYSTLRTAESYNPVTKQTTDLPDMSSPRHSCSAVVIEDNIYVVGGYNEKERALNSVEQYSISNEKWTTIPCMSTARASAAATTATGMLYVVGGCTHDSCGGSICPTEGPESPTGGPGCRPGWRSMRFFPDDISEFSTTSGDPELDSPFNYLDTGKSVECYDPQANIWTNLRKMSVARSNTAIAVL